MASSSEFPRNFVKSPNGSPTAIIFPQNSSVFSEEHIFPRNFLGIFRRIDISSEFRRYIPRKPNFVFPRNFLGNSSIPRDIPRISFSVRMSVRIPLFSCSDLNLARKSCWFGLGFQKTKTAPSIVSASVAASEIGSTNGLR
ncbi:hypothetical protein F2Q68_00017292 [Brassica cretica]|uniref:Uncharacterized protein n=1 Tax=Brassica cretica TaxID=69181 RepID=A0A8S9HDD0_BRACR|nr:hypothetical protein F2Q68_00017292 [Brassica cretica]